MAMLVITRWYIHQASVHCLDMSATSLRHSGSNLQPSVPPLGKETPRPEGSADKPSGNLTVSY